ATTSPRSPPSPRRSRRGPSAPSLQRQAHGAPRPAAGPGNCLKRGRGLGARDRVPRLEPRIGASRAAVDGVDAPKAGPPNRAESVPVVLAERKGRILDGLPRGPGDSGLRVQELLALGVC